MFSHHLHPPGCVHRVTNVHWGDVSGSGRGGDEGSGGIGAAHMVPVSVPRIDRPLSYLASAKTHSSAIDWSLLRLGLFSLLYLFFFSCLVQREACWQTESARAPGKLVFSLRGKPPPGE